MIMQVEHLSKSFGGRTLFSDVTFKLEEYDRLALVGPNGAGKTTMLNIISGREDADEGRILFAKGARVGYLEQEAIEMPDRPIFEEVMSSQVEILEAEQRLRELEESLGDNPTERQLAAAGRARDAYEMLGGYTIEAKVRSVMFGLGFKEGDIKQATTNFSGGWQMRIALAKLLVRNPEVLMLDEPTNHLDLESVKWLEGFLRGYEGTVIVVSHDREFLDNLVTTTLALEGDGQVREYVGGYTDWLRQRPEPVAAHTDKPKPKPLAPPAKIGPRKLTFKEQRELQMLKDELEALPGKMAALEDEQHTLEDRLNDPGFFARDPDGFNATAKRISELDDEQTAALQRWEDVEFRIAELEGKAEDK